MEACPVGGQTERSDNNHSNWLWFLGSLGPGTGVSALGRCGRTASSSLYCYFFLPVCGPRAVVHIQVKDVNEFAPTFKEPAYRAVVTEGKIYDSILQVEAVDEDCSPQYSQICNYEIVTTDVPFAIDRNGECPERTPVGGREIPPPPPLRRPGWALGICGR